MRCDLGPVDKPNDPPCVRCRRESKDCYFSATRRKRKADDGEGEEASPDEYAVYNRRRKTSHGQTPSNTTFTDPIAQQDQSQGNGRSHSPSSPEQEFNWGTNQRNRQSELYSDGGIPGRANTPGDQEVTNETAAVLFQSPINGPADALHLLLEASGRTADLQQHASNSERERTSSMPSRQASSGRSGLTRTFRHQDPAMQIDPAITGSMGINVDATELRETLKIWSRLRFVRAGWLTAREAMAYVE